MVGSLSSVKYKLAYLYQLLRFYFDFFLLHKIQSLGTTILLKSRWLPYRIWPSLPYFTSHKERVRRRREFLGDCPWAWAVATAPLLPLDGEWRLGRRTGGRRQKAELLGQQHPWEVLKRSPWSWQWWHFRFELEENGMLRLTHGGMRAVWTRGVLVCAHRHCAKTVVPSGALLSRKSVPCLGAESLQSSAVCTIHNCVK